MTDSSTDPPPILEPGVRAARLRLGLSQDEVADLVGANRTSFKPWDRGERTPRDPEMLQALSEALQTPLEVLWPPDANPIVGPKLKALRDQRALEQAQALKAQEEQNPEADPCAPPTDSDPLWAARIPAPEARRVPDPLEILRTIDGEDKPPGTSRTRRRRRLVIPGAAALAVIVAGTAIATTSGEDPAASTIPAAQVTAVAAERQRGAWRASLATATERGDFDQAITIAARLNDTGSTERLRSSAAGVLARRAETAVGRGDLPLATSRLNKARERYGPDPALDAVRDRIEAIEAARRERAVERRHAARKRVTARARAAAQARAAAAVPRRVAPEMPVSPSAPAPIVPASPAPSASPAPAPSAGGSSGGSSGGSRSGGGSSSGAAVDPGLY